jgi:uncharacterized Zn finger protein
MKEASFDKGRRYLTSGRLRVVRVDGDHVAATCRGDNAQVYTCGHEDGSWFCDCPALGRSGPSKCSHLTALMLVTVLGSAA